MGIEVAEIVDASKEDDAGMASKVGVGSINRRWTMQAAARSTPVYGE